MFNSPLTRVFVFASGWIATGALLVVGVPSAGVATGPPTVAFELETPELEDRMLGILRARYRGTMKLREGGLDIRLSSVEVSHVHPSVAGVKTRAFIVALAEGAPTGFRIVSADTLVHSVAIGESPVPQWHPVPGPFHLPGVTADALRGRWLVIEHEIVLEDPWPGMPRDHVVGSPVYSEHIHAPPTLFENLFDPAARER